MRKLNGEKWEQEDINILLEFISEERTLYMADIERLKKAIPVRTAYAIYQKIYKLAAELGIRARSKGVHYKVRPKKVRNSEEQEKLKLRCAIKPTTKEGDVPREDILDTILGGMVVAVKELLNSKAIECSSHQKELEDSLTDAYIVSNRLTEENNKLKEQLRSLTGIREAAEKYRSFTNGR